MRQAHDSHREISLKPWSVFEACQAALLVKLQRLFTLGRHRGGAAELWLAQQTAYDLWQTRQVLKKTKALESVRSAGRRAA